ncbi:MAG: hypothetical protein CME40_08615 [Haliea sp.]|nr:hypothetical protein [Haliea sp.]|tara:strand:+ start:102460 stop:105084 length:2625 start_codon:yes stop_codon:yes gene_type:complete
MKLISLTLDNWRGVSHSQIDFDDGVTLIEGPNEVGKSSLVEALRMLFREKSGSKKQQVQAVQPVGEDVGSSVSAEVRCGEYHFTYAKTYNRKHGTELRILAPRAEQLTGDDAHNRAWEILSSHIDTALWDSLLVEQGKEIGGVKLSDSDGLARALDNAAGGSGVSGEESALFGAVQAEYERYFTLKSGKPRFADEQLRVADYTAQVASLRTRGQELEEDLRRFEGVSAEISRLQRALPELKAAREQHTERWAAVDSLQHRLAAREDELKPLEQLLDNACGQWEQRQQAGADIARRSAELEEKKNALQPLAERAEALERAVKDAESGLRGLRDRRRELWQARVQAQQDVSYLQDAAELSRLQQLLDRVQAQRGEVEKLRENLAGIHITAEGRKAIQAAATALEVARRTRDNAATRLDVEALQGLELQLDGESLKLSAGEALERRVASALQLEIPGLARLRVTPAVSAGDLAEEVESRQQELDDLLARYQVGSVEQAIAQDERRVDTEQAMQAARGRIDDILQGSDEDSLQAEYRRLQQACDDALAQRDSALPLPASAQEARARLEEASKALELCEADLERKTGGLEQQRGELARAQADHQQANTEANALASVLDEKRASLKRESEARPDATLEQAVTEQQNRLDAIAGELDQLRDELKAADPESARLQLDNATKAFQRAERDIIELEQEQAVLTSRLDRAQANGLFEELEHAEQALEEAEDTLAATERRAAAAKLLWETLNQHRDASRQAYVRPLRDGIQSLGKIVFGSDFDVTLAEDWTILDVTRNGQTVPFDSLSIGAKEQLGILTRLAAARIVADDGGVPVIIDDALGFSDPTRLQSMGAAIAAAGGEAQVVLLSCTPGRFMHVGDVGVRRL